MIEYLYDSSYMIISILGLLVTLESVEKDKFFDYVDRHRQPFIPDYYIRALIAIMSHACMGHGMYLISTGNHDSVSVIFMHLSQLLIGLMWYIVFYNFTLSRWSIIVALVNIFLSAYNMYVWNRLISVSGLLMIPYLVTSIMHLSLNYHIINTYSVKKTE